MSTQTLDREQIAALVLLYGTREEKARAHRELTIADGGLCPEGDNRNIEDNGSRRYSDVSYRCCACNHQWDAADCTVTLPARAPIARAED